MKTMSTDIASESISALIMKGKIEGKVTKRAGNLGNLLPCNRRHESDQNREGTQSKLVPKVKGTLGIRSNVTASNSY